MRYLDDGCLEISNNVAERAIRPLALGRKNYLFGPTLVASGRRQPTRSLKPPSSTASTPKPIARCWPHRRSSDQPHPRAPALEHRHPLICARRRLSACAQSQAKITAVVGRIYDSEQSEFILIDRALRPRYSWINSSGETKP